jgi:hypothetical protein
MSNKTKGFLMVTPFFVTLAVLIGSVVYHMTMSLGMSGAIFTFVFFTAVSMLWVDGLERIRHETKSER